MQVNFEWPQVIRYLFSPEGTLILSLIVLVFGLVVGFVVWKWTRQFLSEVGVPDLVEGTPFERTARSLGTSTVGIVSNLAALFVYVVAITVALNIARLVNPEAYWTRVTEFLPDLFIAAFALIIGLIAGDKARLVVSERLRSVKLPEATILPEIVKYSIFFLAILIALGQLGVDIIALLVLLGAYSFGLVFLTGLALKDLLAASAAGLYLLLTEPYSIGDEVIIDDRQGIVQEVDVFVTHVESDGKEFVIPNQIVMRSGIVRVRD
ncbi:mechanosensitive ion channel domain-containing protein [Haloarcula litorea]|uniref:mechanosensitive ion channel domain-containing protein n=1 Tax=Haloarcula litorea TaxID=3032579 RepID=UPI0023E7D35A|nr:mechanosensitive ion channel domain-containing protein [Halomicroarcula sp. GDY20]